MASVILVFGDVDRRLVVPVLRERLFDPIQRGRQICLTVGLTRVQFRRELQKRRQPFRVNSHNLHPANVVARHTRVDKREAVPILCSAQRDIPITSAIEQVGQIRTDLLRIQLLPRLLRKLRHRRVVRCKRHTIKSDRCNLRPGLTPDRRRERG